MGVAVMETPDRDHEGVMVRRRVASVNGNRRAVSRCETDPAAGGCPGRTAALVRGLRILTDAFDVIA